MAAVFNWGNIFELIINGLTKRAPAQQEFIEQRQKLIMPIFAKGGLSAGGPSQKGPGISVLKCSHYRQRAYLRGRG